jgi:cytochrome P450
MSAVKCAFDHHDPSLRGDVLDAVYDGMRTHGALAWSDAYGGFWIATSYADIRAIELDPATYSSAQGVFVPRVDGQLLSVALEQDPPEHTWFRKLYNELLGRQAVAQHHDVIAACADRHIAAFVERGGGEFMSEVAAKIPVEVISYLLGLPPSISSQLRELSEEAWADHFGDPAAVPMKMAHLLMDEAMQRLAEPRDDFLTRLVAAEIDGRPIAPDEVVNFLLGAAIAGHETTMNAAGTLCYEVALDQALQARVRADRSLVPALIEETLRLRAPVQNFFRLVTRDHELHGHTLHAGDRIMLVFGAANHDPEVFPDPHSLSLDRENNRHLSFGWGIHRCAGANLAQVELRLIADRLLDAQPFELAGAAEFGHMANGGTFVGLRSLPIRF